MTEFDSAAPLVEIYTGPLCSYCARAKSLLASKGIVYREFDVSDADARAGMLQRVPRARTIPQIFIGGEHVGGCDDLERLDAQGRLDSMVGPRGHR